MFTDKLKDFYVSFLYKWYNLEVNLLKKIMLHAINIQGLDPDPKSDPKSNDIKKLESILMAPYQKFSEEEDFYSRKMQAAIADRTKKLKENGFVGVISYPKTKAPKLNPNQKPVELFPSEVAYVTPDKNMEEFVTNLEKQSKEIVDRLERKYTPAYEAVPPPGTPAVNEDLTVSSEEADAILQDKKIFEIINKPNKKKVTKKPVKSVKKTTKKPAKKSRKK